MPPEPEARAEIVVVDNLLGAHKSERARKLIEGRGCQLLFLAPYYSPDFNPIEEGFSKVKGALRKAQAQTREALIEALGLASQQSPQGMRGASSSTAVTI